MTLANLVLLAVNIGIGIIVTLIMFILKDIKDEIKTINKEILNHCSNLDIHCTKDKFKLMHVEPQRV